MLNGFRVSAREEGLRSLARGWAPTLLGYSMQGLCKFGFYEVFKALYSNLLGEVTYTQWLTYNTFVQIADIPNTLLTLMLLG